jgi:hypothetical protein
LRARIDGLVAAVPHSEIERIFREQYGRAVAVLVRARARWVALCQTRRADRDQCDRSPYLHGLVDHELISPAAQPGVAADGLVAQASPSLWRPLLNAGTLGDSPSMCVSTICAVKADCRAMIHHAWRAIGRQQNRWRLICAIMDMRGPSASTGMCAKAKELR